MGSIVDRQRPRVGPAQSAIPTLGLTKEYGRRRAVDTLTIDVPLGVLAGFVRPNAADKSSTIRMLLGVLVRGVGPATNFTCLQANGPFGVVGTEHNVRLTRALAPHDLRDSLERTIFGTHGAGLGFAHQMGARTGPAVSRAVHSAAISGMRFGLRTAKAVAVTGSVIALAAVSGREPHHRMHGRAVRSREQPDRVQNRGPDKQAT